MYIRFYDADRNFICASDFGKDTFIPSVEALKIVPTVVIDDKNYKVGWMETVIGDDREDKVTCVDVIVDDAI